MCVERSKVHVSQIRVVHLNKQAIEQFSEDASIDEIRYQTFSETTIPDLQRVVEGSGKETLQIMICQFKPVHIPCWRSKLSYQPPGTLSVFNFSLDAGQ